MMKALIKTMRPRQWVKNVFIFAALVFDEQLLNLGPLLTTVAGFILLCLGSSTVYLINDLADLVNTGQAIDEFLDEEGVLSVGKQYGTGLEAVVLSWTRPDAAAAGRPTVFEIHSSNASPTVWSYFGETRCHQWHLDLDVSEPPGSLVMYQIVVVPPA